MPNMFLGRIQEHDPASKGFSAALSPALKTTMWLYHGQVLDQGQIGSCTGNAAVEVLMSGPYYNVLKKIFVESDALTIYEMATHIDGIPGVYPPDDTGSSGLAVMKACKKKGWITGYNHAFGIDHALGALMVGPVITGVPWYEDMFTPDKDGFVHPGGAMAGGHEFTVLGYDITKDAVYCLNHWTAQWGLNGFFWIKSNDWDKLLQNGGDVTIPVVSATTKKNIFNCLPFKK
jgi:hypothetical protein